MHTGDEDSKSFSPQEYFDSMATAMEMVVDREPSQGARDLDQQWDKLAKVREHWERTITRDIEPDLENCSS